MPTSHPDMLTQTLAGFAAQPALTCREHNASRTVSDETIPLEGNRDWQVVIESPSIDPDDDTAATEYLITLRRLGSTLENRSIALSLVCAQWSSEHYVLLPGAAYAGNRFPSRPIPYPPILPPAPELRLDSPPILTDVPRLNSEAGPSALIQLTRDCTTPAIAVFDPNRRKALFLFCPAQTRFGDSGLEVVETEDRALAHLNLRVPGIRPETRYAFCDTAGAESPDRGIALTSGLNLTLRVHLAALDCANLRELYARFFELRQSATGAPPLRCDLPFSRAWEILERKYLAENWNEADGYFHVGPFHLKDSPYPSFDWQTGWVGGLQMTVAQLGLGGERTRACARRNIDFALTMLPAPSGLLWGGWHAGRPWGDNFDDTSLPWVMARKNADALYFLLKSLRLIQAQEPDREIPAHWQAALRNLAEALASVWERHGQFGQFLNLETGMIEVGGSCSAAAASAALAEAADWFELPRYRDIAKAAAKAHLQHFADRGYTTGGPGEILQCPDSESAFALLESCVVLSEQTGEAEFLDAARHLAHLCASWCVSYDYPFPPESEFGRLGLRTLGSVWASVQNKHSAPNICTFSGDALFKLFRATGEQCYLTLLQAIARNSTQYLAHPGRPIRGFSITDVGNYATMHHVPGGWISERVQLSDFSEPTGEIFAGSCWCESACMLTVWEVPGLYTQPDTGLVVAIDHVEADYEMLPEGDTRLRVKNPTGFPLVLRVFSESSDQARLPLGQVAALRFTPVALAPGEVRFL